MTQNRNKTGVMDRKSLTEENLDKIKQNMEIFEFCDVGYYNS